jgi:hypothetical protein
VGKEVVLGPNSELKLCSKCKDYKALDLFNNRKASKDGKQGYCKDCESTRRCAYHKANTEQYMLTQAKSRAKKSNLEFNLTIEDLCIPERCPILGITLERGNTYATRDSSPSLDKIYPEKGYVSGNIQVISNRANIMKHNATFNELILLGKWAEQQVAHL